MPGRHDAEAVLKFPGFLPDPGGVGPLLVGCTEDVLTLRDRHEGDLCVEEVVPMAGGRVVAYVVWFHALVSWKIVWVLLMF
ncbi:hypothetical protein D9M69_598120 [compost metagenome]